MENLHIKVVLSIIALLFGVLFSVYFIGEIELAFDLDAVLNKQFSDVTIGQVLAMLVVHAFISRK